MSSELLSEVWKSRAYAGSTLHVLLALADHGAGDGSRIFPSVATVAAMARLSVRSAQRVLRKLEGDGVLRVVQHEVGGYRHTRHYHMDLDRLRAIGRGEVTVDGGLPPDGGDDPGGGERGDTSVTPCENGLENGTGTKACAPPGERGDALVSPHAGARGDTAASPLPVGDGVTKTGDGVTSGASGVTPGRHPNVREHQRTSRARDPAADEAGSRALEQGQGQEGQDEATAAETLAAARAAWPGVKARLAALPRHGEAAVRSWLGKAWVAKADAEAVLLVVDGAFTAMEARKRFGDDLDRAWGRPVRIAARQGTTGGTGTGKAAGREHAA